MAEKTRLMQKYKKCTFTPKLHVGVVLGGSRLVVCLWQGCFFIEEVVLLFLPIGNKRFVVTPVYPASWCMIIPFWTDPVSLYLLNYPFSIFVILPLLNHFYTKIFCNSNHFFLGKKIYGFSSKLQHIQNDLWSFQWKLHLILRAILHCPFIKIDCEFIYCSI